ncbi:MAG TPA: nucleotidyltransferase family protein, partial [Petrotogaceae bacterium]|nr:nucleotidyltransferase family protein [Petrotogaceae bacterium]
MRVLGLIVEYNPFHNGHLYHIKKSVELINPDYTVAVMSGNFVQRGEPAIVDKFARTQMAL